MIASPLICSLLLAADEAPKASNPLEFKSDTALWTFVVFAILLWILWKYAWKPIADGLEKRERHIADNIAAAERQNENARQILADYEKRLTDSHQEVRGLLEQARCDAETLSREMLARAKDEAAAERQRLLQQIEAATAGALHELAQRSATLAVELAGKIVRRRLDPGDHAQLIQDAVAEFAAEKKEVGS